MQNHSLFYGLDYTRHILNGWPMNEILSSQGQQTEKIVDQGRDLDYSITVIIVLESEFMLILLIHAV